MSLLLLSVIAQPVKKSVHAKAATSARRVKLIREKSCVGFMFVICVVVIALLRLRLRYFYSKQRSRTIFRFCVWELLFCPTLLIRRLWPNPSISFSSAERSVNCPVRLQVEMLNRPLTGVCPVVNADRVSRLQQSRFNW